MSLFRHILFVITLVVILTFTGKNLLAQVFPQQAINKALLQTEPKPIDSNYLSQENFICLIMSII